MANVGEGGREGGRASVWSGEILGEIHGVGCVGPSTPHTEGGGGKRVESWCQGLKC